MTPNHVIARKQGLFSQYDTVHTNLPNLSVVCCCFANLVKSKKECTHKLLNTPGLIEHTLFLVLAAHQGGVFALFASIAAQINTKRFSKF